MTADNYGLYLKIGKLLYSVLPSEYKKIFMEGDIYENSTGYTYRWLDANNHTLWDSLNSPYHKIMDKIMKLLREIQNKYADNEKRWNHFRLILNKNGDLTIEHTYIPDWDSWSGLYMCAISDLKENELVVPEYWEKAVKRRKKEPYVTAPIRHYEIKIDTKGVKKIPVPVEEKSIWKELGYNIYGMEDAFKVLLLIAPENYESIIFTFHKFTPKSENGITRGGGVIYSTKEKENISLGLKKRINGYSVSEAVNILMGLLAEINRDNESEGDIWNYGELTAYSNGAQVLRTYLLDN